MRSWVMGRGVVTFSISRAMALASYTPTQMGRTVLPLMSRRMTIGILVTGSIISPRIFISTSEGECLAPDRFCSRSTSFSSIRPPNLITPQLPEGTPGPEKTAGSQEQRAKSQKPHCVPDLSLHGFAYQRVGAGARDPHIQVAAQQPVAFGMPEVQSTVIRGAPDPLPKGLISPFHQHLAHAADQLRVAPDLDRALLLLKDGQAALLLFLRNGIRHGECGGIGTRRVLEAEERIVLDRVEQVERLDEILFGFAREAHDDIGSDGVVPAGALQPGNPLQILLAGV